ncbi:MAG TPA: proliferating cell nuclear antigen (pcna) [Candidatus Acidoferrum sp.]|nr:proliferating cell nuclear antigen (pcna) [Candidatus Acidoferrum sp.]
MFDIKIDDARYWRNCVDSIVSLVDEGAFSITKEGISLKAMDPSGISMVSFFIPSKAFSKYEVEKPTSIGINLENLSKILSSSRSNEHLLIKDSNNKLSIEFVGENSRRRYKLPMIDVKKEADKEPKIEFESTVEVKSDPFREVLKDATSLSTLIGFKTEKEVFRIIAKGDAAELEEEHSGNTDFVKKLSVTKASSVTFNLDYLDRIVRACPPGNSIMLSLKTEEPVKVDYKIGDATVAYFLAPYMES